MKKKKETKLCRFLECLKLKKSKKDKNKSIVDKFEKDYPGLLKILFGDGSKLEKGDE